MARHLADESPDQDALEEPGPEVELETPPPSVRVGEPLVDSYTWHSLESTTAKDEYMMGV
jgi:hypothetical protein